MKKLILAIALLTCTQTFAQKEVEKIKEAASDAFMYDYFDEALALYLKADSLKPNDGNINYHIGMCYFHSHHQEKALPYFKKAEEQQFVPPHVRSELIVSTIGHYVSDDLEFNLARSYHLHHDFKQAIDMYELFRKKLDTRHKHGRRDDKIVKKFIAECENGVSLMQDTADVEIHNLGPNINSEYPDFAPVISADESVIMFTSAREGTTGGARDPENEAIFMEDIYISHKDSNGNWSPAEKIHDNINSDEHDASIGLSADGHSLFIYKNDHHHHGNIFMSELLGEHWTKPQKMPEGINGKHSWEGSASISSDGNVLFFTSDREGKGGYDLYWVKREEDGWGKPQILDDNINTIYDEDAPYIHPNGKTLYFSSKGHNTMGGYDIFKSVFDPATETWSKAENLGYPINSASDDIFFVFSADGKRAYFSSHHEDSYGDEDIYLMKRHQEEETSLIVLKGIIKDGINDEPVDAILIVRDINTGDTIKEYVSNSHTGKYLVVLEPGKKYEIHVEADGGYLPYTEIMELEDNKFHEVERNILMTKPIKSDVIVLKNVFFDVDKSDLRPEAYPELDLYVKVLKRNPNIFIEVAGHTDSESSDAYNIKLSQRRAKAVMEYLVTKGIDKERLIAVGYGEEYPVATNDTDEGKQLNRRTELIIHNTIVEGKDWEKWKHKYGHYKNVVKD